MTNHQHRGYFYNRTRHDLDMRDRQREKLLANKWERMNARSPGVEPLLTHLVPNYTEDQAKASATIIQWLGSTVGFNFLQDVLGEAGYKIVEGKS